MLWSLPSTCMLVISIGALLVVAHGLNVMLPQFQSVFGAIAMGILFIQLWGLDVAIWRRCKVDYCSVLELQPSTTLEPNQIWQIATALVFVLTCCLGGVLIFDKHVRLFPGSIGALISTIFTLVVLLVPFPLLFPRTRMFFLRSLGKSLAPLVFGVCLRYNLLADVLTSACQLLWQAEYTICFFTTGNWLSQSAPAVQSCGTGTFHSLIMQPVMYALPFAVRFMQCCVLSWQTRHKKGWDRWSHVVNAGKYLSCVWLVVSSTFDTDLQNDQYSWAQWRWNWLIAVIIKTSYCYVWDICMDWGLGRIEFKLLRKTMLYPYPWVYYMAIVTNFLGRISWSIAISPRQCPPNWVFSLALVEILRRGQWIVFRVENAVLMSGNTTILVDTNAEPMLKEPCETPDSVDEEKASEAISGEIRLE